MRGSKEASRGSVGMSMWVASSPGMRARVQGQKETRPSEDTG